MANLDDALLISREKLINFLGLNANSSQKNLGQYTLDAQHNYVLP